MNIKEFHLGTNIIKIQNKVKINVSKISRDFIYMSLEGLPRNCIKMTKKEIKNWSIAKETINEGNNKRKSNSTSKS